MDCSLPGSSTHGFLQAIILEWVAIGSSRGSSNPGIEPPLPVSPALQADSLPTEPPGKPEINIILELKVEIQIEHCLMKAKVSLMLKFICSIPLEKRRKLRNLY